MTDPRHLRHTTRRADALFLGSSRVLLVHPTYKDTRHIPRLRRTRRIPRRRLPTGQLLFLFGCGDLGADEHRIHLDLNKIERWACVELDQQIITSSPASPDASAPASAAMAKATRELPRTLRLPLSHNTAVARAPLDRQTVTTD